MKMKLYWYEFKYIQYHYEIWNVIIFSVCDDHNVCSYKYWLMLPVRRNILQISAVSFDCSIKIWHARSWLNNALNKNFRNYSQ